MDVEWMFNGYSMFFSWSTLVCMVFFHTCCWDGWFYAVKFMNGWQNDNTQLTIEWWLNGQLSIRVEWLCIIMLILKFWMDGCMIVSAGWWSSGRFIPQIQSPKWIDSKIKPEVLFMWLLIPWCEYLHIKIYITDVGS